MSESFSPAWLALRESADAAARSRRLTALARIWATRQRRPSLRVLDLGCGSGANLRYLAPALGPRQRWLLLDDDPAVLTEAARRLPDWARGRGYAVSGDGGRLLCAHAHRRLRIELQRLDIRDPERLPPAELLTASALLDLTSADWLRRLARVCRQRATAVLITLSYNGLRPERPFDRQVQDWFNLDQRRDKGFGPALGAEAGSFFAAELRRLGYRVALAPSCWRLDSRHAALREALLQGVVAAAASHHPRPALQAWAARRQDETQELLVGHLDLFARL